MTTYRTAPVPASFWDKHNSDRSQDRISKADRAGLPSCSVCGAVLNPERAQVLHIIGGGGSFLHRDDEALYVDTDGADMGCWPVGPECARLAPAAFRSPYTPTPERADR